MSSNRIVGAKVKAAALVHANKQLANLGFTVKSGAGAVTFKGQQAYAYWDAAGQYVSGFGINYPALPDNSLLSRREADFISAYTLHEIGHVGYTSSGASKTVRGLRFYLYNGIEDARIEHAVIASGKARGARSMFKKLMGKFTAKIVNDGKFNPCKINSAPFALALICRAAYGDGNGFAKQLLNRIPEPYQSLYAAAANGVLALPLDRTGSAGAVALGDAFLKGWLVIDPNAMKAPFQPPAEMGGQQSQDSGEESQDSDDSQGDSDESGEDDDQQSGADESSGSYGLPAPQGEGGGSDAEDGDDAEDADGPTAKELADEAEADSLKDDLKNASEDGPEADTSVFDPVSEDGEDDAEGAGGDGAGDAPYTPPTDPEEFSEEEVIKPEPDVNDIFKSATDRTRSPVNLRPIAPPRRSLMKNWRNLSDVTDQTKRRAFKKLHQSAMPAMKAQLFRILKAPERCGWDSGALGGRFDNKRSPRMLAGSEQVFKRRWDVEGVNTAVSIVVDLSGSMSGERISQAVDLAWTVSEACERAGAIVEVVGFTTNGYTGYGGYGEDLQGDYKTSGLNADHCSLVVCKRFGDKVSAIPHHFSAMKRLASGGTPDYAAVRSVCEQLSTVKASRKVCMVITDGFGDVADMLALGNASFNLFGIDVIGLGINCSAQDLARAYSIGCPVDLDTIHKSGLKTVIKQLDMRDTRRVI